MSVLQRFNKFEIDSCLNTFWMFIDPLLILIHTNSCTKLSSKPFTYTMYEVPEEIPKYLKAQISYLKYLNLSFFRDVTYKSSLKKKPVEPFKLCGVEKAFCM